MRRNYDALVAAGLDTETMPFEIYFMRYHFQGAFSWILIVAVFETLFADGKDDEYAAINLSWARDLAFRTRIGLRSSQFRAEFMTRNRYLVPLIYTRLAAFCDDHGAPIDVNMKSKAWRERLLHGKKA